MSEERVSQTGRGFRGHFRFRTHQYEPRLFALAGAPFQLQHTPPVVEQMLAYLPVPADARMLCPLPAAASTISRQCARRCSIWACRLFRVIHPSLTGKPQLRQMGSQVAYAESPLKKVIDNRHYVMYTLLVGCFTSLQGEFT